MYANKTEFTEAENEENRGRLNLGGELGEAMEGLNQVLLRAHELAAKLRDNIDPILTKQILAVARDSQGPVCKSQAQAPLTSALDINVALATVTIDILEDMLGRLSF